jgi:NAD(P)-dependent dehydrogenase (short-subunit alcohol dehydrogenase family)
MKLAEKRVLITGGSSGIGFAIAKAILAKGARVAITGRRSAVVAAAVDELRKAGGSVAGIAADVGTGEERALAQCRRQVRIRGHCRKTTYPLRRYSRPLVE